MKRKLIMVVVICAVLIATGVTWIWIYTSLCNCYRVTVVNQSGVDLEDVRAYVIGEDSVVVLGDIPKGTSATRILYYDGGSSSLVLSGKTKGGKEISSSSYYMTGAFFPLEKHQFTVGPNRRAKTDE